jgi:hypothetical protein
LSVDPAPPPDRSALGLAVPAALAWAALAVIGPLRGLTPAPGLGTTLALLGAHAAGALVIGAAAAALVGRAPAAARAPWAVGGLGLGLGALLIGVELSEGALVPAALRGAALAALGALTWVGRARPRLALLLLLPAATGGLALLRPPAPAPTTLGALAALEGDPGKAAGGLLLVTVDGARADAVAQLTRPAVAGQPQGAPTLGALGTARTALAPAPAAAAGVAALLGVGDPAGALAERWAGQGAATAAFTSGAVPQDALPVGALRGFGLLDEGGSPLLGLWATPLGRALAALGLRGGLRADPHTVDAAAAWLRQQPPGPTLLWVHLSGPLPPFAPAPPFDTAFYAGDPRDPAHRTLELIPADQRPAWAAGVTDLAWVDAQYRGEIAQVDRAVTRLLELWPEGPPPAVAVVGTHGLTWAEDGSWFQAEGRWLPPVLQVPVLARGVPLPPPPLSLAGVGRALRDRGGEAPEAGPVVAVGPDGPLLWAVAGGLWTGDGRRWDRVRWSDPGQAPPEVEAELSALP